jgi:hypothetical protein
MNYEEMSDNEINEQVADLMGGYAGNVHGSETMVKVSDSATNGMFYMEVDYCNNPSDAWPIITANKIAVLPWNNSEWQSFLSLGGAEGIRFRTIHGSPLRAAMIVFLMMKESYK